VDWDLAFAVTLIGFAGAVAAVALCAARRAMRRRGGGRPGLPPPDRATMAGDPLAGRFIPMPSRLSTRDEMVAWMTRDLPRLTAEQPDPRTDGARPGVQRRRSGTRRV
jgi:hypothetical protein